MLVDKDLVEMVALAQDTLFWTGHGWSPEYPDAVLLDEQAAATVRKMFPGVKIIADYGYTSERVIE